MTNEEVDAANLELVRAYRLTFGSPSGKAVLQDLVLFCRGAGTTFGDDKYPIEILEGRRQVFLRIQNFNVLSPEELVRLALGRPIRQQGGE